MVEGLEFRLQGSGFRVQGSGVTPKTQLGLPEGGEPPGDPDALAGEHTALREPQGLGLGLRNFGSGFRV